jgi:hypothetical protein
MDNSFKSDFRDECIAYALATGMVPSFSCTDVDADAERSARRARWLRRKGQKGSR